MQQCFFAFISFLMLTTTISNGLWRGEKGYVRFESDAPLELITAESKMLRGLISPEDNTFAFSIPASSFEGFNSALQQEHFHENYLESNKYPQASFSGKFIEDIRELSQGTHEVRTKGMLRIHGVEVERIIKCRLSISEDEILITSNFTVPLSDHKITIPQVVHQKIAEEIFVEVKISMKQS